MMAAIVQSFKKSANDELADIFFLHNQMTNKQKIP